MLGQFGSAIASILPKKEESSLFFGRSMNNGGGVVTLGFGDYGKYITEKLKREEEQPLWVKDLKRVGLGIGGGALVGGAFGAIDNSRGFATDKAWYGKKVGTAAGVGAGLGGAIVAGSLLASNLFRKPKRTIVGHLKGEDNG